MRSLKYVVDSNEIILVSAGMFYPFYTGEGEPPKHSALIQLS